MQGTPKAGRTPAAKFAVAVMAAIAAAFLVFAWGQQIQADCIPQHGTACVENVVPNQLAFGFAVFAVGLTIVGLAMWLYGVGVNGFLEDLKAQAGKPASKRRK